MAVEVFHNFSLVHDDIMDEAPLRRGFTVHEKVDVNTAILSGCDVNSLSIFRKLPTRIIAQLMAYLVKLLKRFVKANNGI